MAIEITGLEQLRARLRILDEQVRTVIVKDAVRAGAQVIASAMREQAPERAPGMSGDALPPGALRAGIGVRERVDRDGFAVAHIGPGKSTAHVARLVEFGHREIRRAVDGTIRQHVRGGGMGKVVGHVPAHPFLRPAVERSEAPAIEKFKEVMRMGIAEALK